jgi:signal transduction histidine kinase
VGLYSLDHTAAAGSAAVTQQLAVIDDAAAVSAFQYQKGFVAEYLLTGNRQWLAELEASRPVFEQWLEEARRLVGSSPAGEVVDQIRREYGEYDHVRERAVELNDRGAKAEAVATLAGNHARAQRLWQLFRDFGHLARADAERKLAEGRATVRELGRVLVGTSIAGAVASLLVGFWWSRRVTKPINELAVRVESAAERTRIQVSPTRDGFDKLGSQVSALVDKLEQTDAALAEHRRRLVQSEKLSAMGELSAKLAHEILNPLAGMKGAVQLMALEEADSGRAGRASPLAAALEKEIGRVEGLVRRLVDYSRPLAPHIELVSVGTLLETALQAARRTLQAHSVTVNVHEEAGLPRIEVDPLLIVQVLVNLLTNAAQALGPQGGHVELSARSAVVLGRREISIEVTDRGPGIAEALLPDLFKPFFTTKTQGHGLGLALSLNIVLEHGGRILARNRPLEAGGGAAFEVQLPVAR